jgi:phosphoribosylformylglycinamidine synthase
MSLSPADHEVVVDNLGREPTPAEEALFENLWSEHCAYRSSRMLLSRFDSEGEQVIVGPGDDAAVVALPTDPDEPDVYITLGIESHNHPSYVDPFDGAATGVGGIVRDTLSMGAYPIALTDSLYFGEFDREHSRYLFDGVVEGISHYGNCIGVPTVGGSVSFHEQYEGNPLVNVACIGLLTDTDRLVTAKAQQTGNRLVLIGNATGRDGLGGASFASEDLAEDAETEDRPAVQVGDPYSEKLLIEASEELIDRRLVESARDLGAAGLGGASSEMVAKGQKGARINLNNVHQREPDMVALEILLAESQERMCYEVSPANIDSVREVAAKYDLGFSDIGEVTDGNYVCTFDGETVVDTPAEQLTDGAPLNELETQTQATQRTALPAVDITVAFDAVVSAPNTASKRWVYRQYDHEVGLRTAVSPGADAAVLAVREAVGTDGEGIGLALSAGAEPNWTAREPYEGARACVVENATNLATKGAVPLAAVDCLNGGNPETPHVYGGFADIVSGLADACHELSVPVVGGNVSLYNDSATGPIPPTPTLAMVGTRSGFEAPSGQFTGEGELLVVGDRALSGEPIPLGGSEYLAQFDGEDAFPEIPSNSSAFIQSLRQTATHESVVATHDVSHGGLAVSLAEMVAPDAGAEIVLGTEDPHSVLFNEAVGRAIIETTDPEAVRAIFDGIASVTHIGATDDSGVLNLTVEDTTIDTSHDDIVALRSVIEREMD